MKKPKCRRKIIIAAEPHAQKYSGGFASQKSADKKHFLPSRITNFRPKYDIFDLNLSQFTKSIEIKWWNDKHCYNQSSDVTN